MFLSVLGSMSLNLIYFTLHVLGSGGSFPKPLTQAEEDMYIAKMQEGDSEARSILIERNLRLVAHIIKKYYANAKDQDDLVSIGTIGLIKAVSTFNGGKGTRLATYASRCIENEILMYLRKNNGRKTEISIDEPLNVDWDGNELLLSDILGTDNDIIYHNLETEIDKELLEIAMQTLTPRERNIMELRFGIRRRDAKTQKEVADILGISQSYISRLEKKIISRLKKEITRLI